VSKELQTLHDFCESELNAFYTHKKITDELRGYKKPYSATLMGHEVDEKTMLAVVEAVKGRMDIPRRFFALKKKLLEKAGSLKPGEKMRLYDTNAPLPSSDRLSLSEPGLSFEQGYETVRAAYAGIDADSVRIYEDAFRKGQVDVYAKKGKGGGGFHSKTVGAPGVILLNYVPDRRSQFTLAHEMGHFLHSTYSERYQRPIYQHYSTAAAEVASTFGEQVLFHHVLPTVSGEEKRVLLHENVLENITAVFRVIADYTCEDELYARVYSEGYLPMDEVTKTYVESRKQYVGDSVELTPNDGYRVVYTSHFRLKYYWYSYAFGCLIARALYARVQKDPAYITQVKQFLSAGGSDSPKNIFKKIGIDITKPSFWQEGIDAIEKDLAEFEKLVK
jgi:oligoendopeptidase F